MDLLIIGVGQFGSALAHMYQRQGRRVRKIENSQSLTNFSENILSNSISLLCVPTQSFPKLMEQRGDVLSRSYCLVSTAKGLIQDTGHTPTECLRSHFPKGPPIFALSGPSFSTEINKGQPTALVLAGNTERQLNSVIDTLSTRQLRLYKSLDRRGVELCGALKNVYAIAAGISAGLGFGDSTRAALMTRALAEMSRTGQSLGGQPLTFFGLAGVGDLFLTCSSPLSRNFQFGYGLAKGKTSKKLLLKLGTVEGVWTASAAKKVCHQHKIRTPLLDMVVALLEKKINPQEALERLMTRKIRHEFD